jgi:HAD superfamily hydrolase (TIGR01509 family)
MTTAWIFDFDGVLVNTMEGHFACYSQALAEHGIPVDRSQFFSQAGMTGREQIAHFAAKAGVTIDPDAVYRRKKEIFDERQPEAVVIASMAELFRVLRGAGARLAIATGSSRASVLPVIAKLGLDPAALAAAEDVTRGKPHPDLFLLAAHRLGAAPAECVVVEDSDVGIEAARRAGMRSLRFTDLGA